MKYITKPPVLPNVPPFLAKRYGLFDDRFVYSLVEWARKEYYDMVIYLYSINIDQAKELESPKYSYVDFIAHTSAFKKVLETMTDEVWNLLDKGTRNILINAKDICERP